MKCDACRLEDRFYRLSADRTVARPRPAQLPSRYGRHSSVSHRSTWFSCHSISSCTASDAVTSKKHSSRRETMRRCIFIYLRKAASFFVIFLPFKCTYLSFSYCPYIMLSTPFSRSPSFPFPWFLCSDRLTAVYSKLDRRRQVSVNSYTGLFSMSLHNWTLLDVESLFLLSLSIKVNIKYIVSS